ncbi:MAG: 1-phosphofructokinase family hexose kinase [Lachnospiraceae bacterium]|nr:1-phosphofructokinase family hexose kinase [Lachnospiraceae bacterium]
MVYTLTLNPSLDYVMYPATYLKKGGTNRSEREELRAGGKGINVSVVLKNLDVPTKALGFIAGTTGDEIEGTVRSIGIRTGFIMLPFKNGMSRINVKIRVPYEDSSERGFEETELNAAGPVVESGSVDELCDQLERLSEGDVLVLAGSMPTQAPEDMLERILSSVPENVKTVVDMTGDRLKRALPFGPFLVKPNLEELCQAAGRELKDEKEIISEAEKLQKSGAENVIVSMGADGAILLDKTGEIHRCKAPEGKALGAFGAGDSMTAGFIKGFLDEHDYGYALKLGIAAGSAAVFEGKLPDYNEIMKVFDEV